MRVYIIIVSEVMNGRLPSSSDVHTSAGVRAPAHIKIIRETGMFLVFSVMGIYMLYDIVYILKNNYTSDELRYSLRSVCRNFPYRKIWFYGGKPEGIEPDEMIEVVQTGSNKWQKVNSTLRLICQNDEITENFWLFNDDFFIMQQVKGLDPMYAGTLEERVGRIRDRYGGRMTAYARQLKDSARILANNGCDTYDYALHVPMLINREKALKTLKKFGSCPMFRSLYGNHHRIGGVRIRDVKIQSEDKEPTGRETLLSTNDKAFGNGKVGEFIRAAFPDRCKYEVD